MAVVVVVVVVVVLVFVLVLSMLVPLLDLAIVLVVVLVLVLVLVVVLVIMLVLVIMIMLMLVLVIVIMIMLVIVIMLGLALTLMGMVVVVAMLIFGPIVPVLVGGRLLIGFLTGLQGLCCGHGAAVLAFGVQPCDQGLRLLSKQQVYGHGAVLTGNHLSRVWRSRGGGGEMATTWTGPPHLTPCRSSQALPPPSNPLPKSTQNPLPPTCASGFREAMMAVSESTVAPSSKSVLFSTM